MKKRNILAIILIILIMICVIGYIFTLANNGSEMNNASYNNSTNPQLNKSVDKNTSLNKSDDSNNIDNLDSSSMKHYNFQYAKKSKVNSDEITEDDILEIVKNGVWWDDEKGKSTQDVKLGKPYKVKEGFWLVGAFDKKTGKFLGAVWVGPDGGGFSNGPDSYSEYKDIISGKYIHESKSNKNDVGGKSAPVEDKIPDFSERYVLATPNPNMFDGSDVLISNQGDMNLDNDVYLNSDQLMPVIESDCKLNSTG